MSLSRRRHADQRVGQAKLNTRSSTKTELVAADDMMPLILWTSHFLQAQGYTTTDTILYQDRVKVELKYLPGERVMISAECPSDTIRVETIRIVNQPIEKKGMGWEGLIGWTIAILCLLVIIKQVLNKLI